MRKRFRHNVTRLSVMLVVLTGLWLVLPHDVCLTKLVAQSGCVCPEHSESQASNCSCCSADNVLACGHDGENGMESETDSTPANTCFSISSDISRMTGPERAPDAAPVMAVVAVLPLPLEAGIIETAPVYSSEGNNPALDRHSIHQDNCVYII